VKKYEEHRPGRVSRSGSALTLRIEMSLLRGSVFVFIFPSFFGWLSRGWNTRSLIASQPLNQ
jgi:hypothetical protein